MIKLVAKLRIIKLRRRKKEREERKERFDALGHKQVVLPTAKYDPGVAHRFPRSGILILESVRKCWRKTGL